MTADRRSYVIDGQNFTTLDQFYEEAGRVLIPGQQWGRGLDSFNDILSWPTWPSLEPGQPYLLIWKNSILSKQRLGHEAMAERLEQIRRWMLRTGHDSNLRSITEELQAAKERKGPTLFDLLVEITRHNKEFVELRLE
jgi:hypothetical protein